MLHFQDRETIRTEVARYIRSVYDWGFEDVPTRIAAWNALFDSRAYATVEASTGGLPDARYETVLKRLMPHLWSDTICRR